MSPLFFSSPTQIHTQLASELANAGVAGKKISITTNSERKSCRLSTNAISPPDPPNDQVHLPGPPAERFPQRKPDRRPRSGAATGYLIVSVLVERRPTVQTSQGTSSFHRQFRVEETAPQDLSPQL